MRLLGATVVPVTTGTKTLKDATNEAFRDWVANVETTHYCIGSVVGPHPFPMMVRDFQRIIGVEARQQCLDLVGRLPDAVVACVGGGSNAMGLFHPFIADEAVALIGCEAGGEGIATGHHAAPLTAGSPGVLHGARSYLMQDDDGQTQDTTSISAGLDYPGVGPEHAFLRDSGRAQYRGVTDADAMAALEVLAKSEGILCAIETAHAFAGTFQWLAEQGDPADKVVIVNTSGRGDKDVDTAARWFKLVTAEEVAESEVVKLTEGESP
jgi:tryptophan synthase beta chain